MEPQSQFATAVSSTCCRQSAGGLIDAIQTTAYRNLTDTTGTPFFSSRALSSNRDHICIWLTFLKKMFCSTFFLSGSYCRVSSLSSESNLGREDAHTGQSFQLFLRFCRTWTKRYLITSQTRVKRVSRIHHRTILIRQNLQKRLFGLAARNRLSLSLPLSFSPSSSFLSFSIQKWKVLDCCTPI